MCHIRIFKRLMVILPPDLYTTEPHPHTTEPHPHTTRPHPHTTRPHPHTTRPHPHTTRPHPHTTRPHPHTTEPHPHTTGQTRRGQAPSLHLTVHRNGNVETGLAPVFRSPSSDPRLSIPTLP